MSGIAKKSGKKNRKHGRNTKKCDRYEREGRREANKARGLREHLRSHPHDKTAMSAVRRIGKEKPNLVKWAKELAA